METTDLDSQKREFAGSVTLSGGILLLAGTACGVKEDSGLPAAPGSLHSCEDSAPCGGGSLHPSRPDKASGTVSLLFCPGLDHTPTLALSAVSSVWAEGRVGGITGEVRVQGPRGLAHLLGTYLHHPSLGWTPSSELPRSSHPLSPQQAGEIIGRSMVTLLCVPRRFWVLN